MFLNALSPISSSPARFGALYLEPRITEPKTGPRQVWFAPYIVDLQGPMTGMQHAGFREDGLVLSRDKDGHYFQLGTQLLPAVEIVTRAFRQADVFASQPGCLPENMDMDTAKTLIVANLQRYQDGKAGFLEPSDNTAMSRIFGPLPLSQSYVPTLRGVIQALQKGELGIATRWTNLDAPTDLPPDTRLPHQPAGSQP
ncbi:MAG: hypothetical protein KC462_09395 [Cyanobacteria bacterium HKST-UBA05]|nr:hypothetical protein [Cyanobacteria bacterium HKST-UBA05]